MTWAVSPEIFHLGPLTLRWYGLLFALGFVGCYVYLSKYVFGPEDRPSGELDNLLIYVMIGTVAGARLGHCLFYEPQRYLEDPIQILFVWQGGLASHGAVIGILTSLWMFSRKTGAPTFWWLADRVSISVPIAAVCIRLGNFFNSEIIGKATDMPWAIIFSRVDMQPRHPSMLYEAVAYLFTFFLLAGVYSRQRQHTPPGSIMGLLLVLIFAFRFFVEFTKENQVDFESGMPLNMGQILSIPAVAVGIWLMKRSRRYLKSA